MKAGDRETKAGLRIEEATGESPGGALLWLPRKVIGKEWAKVGLLLAHQEVREKGGPGDRIGGEPHSAAAAHCPPWLQVSQGP